MSDDEAELAFVLSKVAVIDEMATSAHRRLAFVLPSASKTFSGMKLRPSLLSPSRFVDFLEAVWRLCHQCRPEDPAAQFDDFIANVVATQLRTKVDRANALRLAIRCGMFARDSKEAGAASEMLGVPLPPVAVGGYPDSNSPAKSMGSPAKSVGSPAKSVGSHAKSVGSPAKSAAGSYAKSLGSPAKSQGSARSSPTKKEPAY